MDVGLGCPSPHLEAPLRKLANRPEPFSSIVAVLLAEAPGLATTAQCTTSSNLRLGSYGLGAGTEHVVCSVNGRAYEVLLRFGSGA